MYMYMPFFDPTFFLLIPAMIIAAWAQMKVSSTLNKYSKVTTMNGYTGAEIARSILDSNGLYDVPVERAPGGSFSDHYDPRSRVVRLSQDVYSARTVAAAGVAAHEVGHAIQHATGYKPLSLRTSIASVVGFASNISVFLFFIGLLFTIQPLQTLGIVLFSAAVFYQLVTLPVEFNASSRALKIIENNNILYGNELTGAKKCLTAAAMTYVAAAIMSISQLLRLVLISNRDD